jgi:hypothetical protein
LSDMKKRIFGRVIGLPPQVYVHRYSPRRPTFI